MEEKSVKGKTRNIRDENMDKIEDGRKRKRKKRQEKRR